MVNDYTMMEVVEQVEKELLCKAITYPETRDDLYLSSKHFNLDKHVNIYEKIITDKNVTEMEILNESVRRHKEFGGYDFMRGILDFPIASKHGIINNQKEVYHFYKMREVAKINKKYEENPNDDTFSEMRRRLAELDAFKFGEENRKLDVLSNIHSDLFGENENALFPTGYAALDQLIDGFEPQQYNVIGARSSMGKTAFALQLAINLQSETSEVVFCSIETTEKKVTQRILSNLSGVNLRKFKNAHQRMTESEVEKVIDVMDAYYKMNITVREDALLTPSMVREIASNVNDDKHGFIIIDYVQQMKPDGGEGGMNEYEVISAVSRELKIITQEFPNITIIPLAQVNRGTEHRQEKRPGMSDIRGSGQLEMDSDQIIMLYRDDYYNPVEGVDPNAPSELEAIVVKNKDGGLGTATLGFYKDVQKIV